jgi:hypothetical protein
MGRPLLNDDFYAGNAGGLIFADKSIMGTPPLFFKLTEFNSITSTEVPANAIIAAASQRLPLDIIGMKGLLRRKLRRKSLRAHKNLP